MDDYPSAAEKQPLPSGFNKGKFIYGVAQLRNEIFFLPLEPL
ncbi:hypothetical protein [Nostoc sp.]